MHNKVVLSTENLCVRLQNHEILHNVSLSIKSSKITVIVGENGCGKSTLCKSLIKIIPSSSGNIMIKDKEIGDYSAKQLAKQIAYLPQKKSIPDLSVMTMVLHGRFAYLGYPRTYRKQDIDIAKQALQTTDLTQFADEKVSRLSGGTQQRVFLAMTLAQQSEIILMDEPTSFLDISHQMNLIELCKNLALKGKAVVMVLHDLPMALKIADEIIVMSDGNVVFQGNPSSAFDNGVLDKVFNVKIKKMPIDGENIYYF